MSLRTRYGFFGVTEEEVERQRRRQKQTGASGPMDRLSDRQMNIGKGACGKDEIEFDIVNVAAALHSSRVCAG